MQSLKDMVQRQVTRVLTRGTRYGSFDQIRNRHFWSKYLFAPGGGGVISASAYDIFRIPPAMSGQGYPVPLTLLETNWRGASRVPDNQNFAITEIGVSITRPQSMDRDGYQGQPENAPTDSIWANLPTGIQPNIHTARATHPDDASCVLYGMILEMSFLTNNVPLGYLSDFSQSSGIRAFEEEVATIDSTDVAARDSQTTIGDPSNGVPAAAFRRKLEVPILLQHGEQVGMRLNAPLPIQLKSLDQGGSGWLEVRVDWWATESFAEKS